jgi:hypothetical protein
LCLAVRALFERLQKKKKENPKTFPALSSSLSYRRSFFSRQREREEREKRREEKREREREREVSSVARSFSFSFFLSKKTKFVRGEKKALSFGEKKWNVDKNYSDTHFSLF